MYLCDVDDLPEIGARGFDLSGRGVDELFVVRRHSLLRSYKNSCPHWPGASMPWRRDAYLDASGTSIVCNGHGARFDIESGICTVGPCAGLALIAVPLWIEGESHVWVRGLTEVTTD
ncbi:Rieske (2Fe-2S) protein [Paraburkholderia sp. WC7.3g]|uniref:Rieske (2Fe-2S) protein n=1 Tax=Paraburkholderia sp. WC7.3g TaxID=2991070 RepID=UPI003D21F03C